MRAPRTNHAFWGRLFIAGAACISLYLSCGAMGRTALPGCGPACEEALHSRWAFVFGIPVSFAGFVLYSLALLLSWAFVRRERTPAGLGGAAAVPTVMAAAVWFTILQVLALDSWCVWCSATHACAVTGALLVCWSRKANNATSTAGVRHQRASASARPCDRIFRFGATGAALTGMGILVLGTLAGPLHSRPAEASAATRSGSGNASASGSDGSIALFGGEYHVNPEQFPVIGHKGASGCTAVLLTDLTRSWCRQHYAALTSFAESSPRPVRIIVLPVAPSHGAETIQRTLLTTFHADRSVWRQLIAQLASGEIEADPDSVHLAALKLLGPENWEQSATAHAHEIDQQLHLGASVMERASAGGGSSALPLLLCGSRVLAGAEHDPARLTAFLTVEAVSGDAAVATVRHAKLEVLNADVHLTALQQGEPKDFEVKVQNLGDAPLMLDWLTLDSDCEVIRLPETAIPAGKTDYIGLRITPALINEKFVRTVKIHSNAPGEPGTVTVRGSTGPAPVAATDA